MSRWIRGRLGRPMASILSLLMLVSILLPLAPPPVQAQGEGVIDWPSVNSDNMNSTPTSLAVLDFNNKSDYKTGMLGRQFSDSLSLALQSTGKFSVVPRTDLDSALQDLGVSIPMDFAAQAMVADKLNVPYAVSGEIEKVSILHTKTGTFAQVTANVYVVSKLTRLPINGARVIQSSSPKIGYVGNKDALVYEALSTAAYQVAQQIIDNRMPIASVLITDTDGNVRLRGGSMMGLKVGMQLVTVRQNSVTGILRVISVTASDSICKVIEDRHGIAPSDKVVQIYNPSPEAKTPQIKKHTAMQIAALVGLGLLVALISRSEKDNNAGVVSATPLANAGIASEPYGANLVTWSQFGDRTNTLAYIIYRIEGTSGDPIPIAMVGYNQLSYLDEGLNFITERDRTYTLSIDPASDDPKSGMSLSFSQTIPTTTNPGYGGTLDFSTDADAVTLTVKDIMIRPGERYSYAIQSIYLTFTPPTTDTTTTSTGMVSKAATDNQYRLKLSNISAIAGPVTVTPPPVFVTPTITGAVDFSTGQLSSSEPATVTYAGTFTYAKVILQVSTSDTFPRASTIEIPAYSQPTTSGQQWIANCTLTDMLNVSNTGVFIRWGGLAATSGIQPKGEKGLEFCDGYVFSRAKYVDLTTASSASASKVRATTTPAGKKPAARGFGPSRLLRR